MKLSDLKIRKGPQKSPVKLILYGKGGIGKTTFAASAPSPIFLAPDQDEQCDASFLPTPHKWEDALAYIEALRTDEHGYETFVIDTIDLLESLAVHYVCQRDDGQAPPGYKRPLRLMVDGKPMIENYGYGSGWKTVLEEFRLLVAALDRLRNERGMHLILLAHEHAAREKNEAGDDYSVITPSLNKLNVGLLYNWSSACLYGSYETLLLAPAEDGRRAKVSATGKRVLHTGRTSAHLAKNRYGLPETMPISWQAFWEHTQRYDAHEASVLRAELLDLAERSKTDDEVSQIKRWLPTAGNDLEKLRAGIKRLTTTEGAKA